MAPGPGGGYPPNVQFPWLGLLNPPLSDKLNYFDKHSLLYIDYCGLCISGFSWWTLWASYIVENIYFETFSTLDCPWIYFENILWRLYILRLFNLMYFELWYILLDIFWRFFNFGPPLMVSIVTGVGGSIVLAALMTTLSQKSWRSYTAPHCSRQCID